MRLYIAGQMSGQPDYAYPTFMAAAAAWRACGWDVLNPAERFDGRTDLPYTVYLNHSMIDVIACDAVAVLPGWESSPGATLEVLYARTVGKPVYQADHPRGSTSSGLRPETGGIWPPAGRLREDGPAVDGLPRPAVPAGGDQRGRSDPAHPEQDSPADGVAGSPGLGGGLGGVRGDVREGDADRPVAEDYMASVCRRCLRPRNEHEPFALPSEWGSCEEFIK